ncbi:Ribonuclease H domain [Arabidopsis thaliana x Arabidopsis arenosa]|uniref:Ribonuclease H domain n=1 Tax=Arabidopsis thaliana x Arabidopsis arenosa TaxID=1240361 RepID=A0A8T2BMP6_9BRAS|nr:Ribonuclease H domain [Arabidopsis thaliana x Arabidopsis arenosa]
MFISYTIEKIDDDAHEWFAAQCVDPEDEEQSAAVTSVFVSDTAASETTVLPAWIPPPVSWLKCNVGIDWSCRRPLMGCSWVLRDDQGTVLLHSRNAIPNIRDRDAASFKGTVWAVENLVSHGISKVILELEDSTLVGCVLRPKAWPSFRCEAFELLRVLEGLQNWKVDVVDRKANRGAHLIAQSVYEGYRVRSYVAFSHLFWLDEVFASEKVVSSVVKTC